jgi:hypothetical protein
MVAGLEFKNNLCCNKIMDNFRDDPSPVDDGLETSTVPNADDLEMTEGRQDTIYEHMLECEQAFYTLPHSEAFDEAMHAHMLNREVHFTQEEPVVLEQEDLPKELIDAFYFPDNPTIQEMAIKSHDDINGNWMFDGSFNVSTMAFSFRLHGTHVVLSNESSDGSPLEYRADSRVFLEFLTILYARTAARKLFRLAQRRAEVQGGDPMLVAEPSTADVHRVTQEMIPEFTPTGLRDLLEKLATLTGKSTVTLRSLFPYTPANVRQTDVTNERAILATLSHAQHRNSEEEKVGIDINWFVMDTNVEVSGEVSTSSDEHVQRHASGHILPIDIDVDEYPFMKEFIGTNLEAAQIVSDKDPRWLQLVTIFMTSIQPLLEQHQELDS